MIGNVSGDLFNALTSGLWLDAPDAIEQLAKRAGSDAHLQRIGLDLIETGFSILPSYQNHQLIDTALVDYERYLHDFAQKA